MGMFSSVGGFVNDVFGATSASDRAFSQSKQLSNMSYNQQKEFAKNAHQWEMEDLRKAGLNPALTTGASSAGSIAGGGSTGGSGSVGSNTDIISALANTINQTKLTNAEIGYKQDLGKAALLQAEAAMKQAGIKGEELSGGAIIRTLGKDATSAFTNRVKQEKEGFASMFKKGLKGFAEEMKRQAKETFKR